MTTPPASSPDLRAKVRLNRREIAHLWNGGVLSPKVEWSELEADLEFSCSEAEPKRGTRILFKRVSAE